MAHFALLWKARTIEKYRQNYENEKYLSIHDTNIPMPQKSLSQRLRCYRQDTQKRFSKIFQRIYPEGSSLSNFFLYLKTDQTCLHLVLKSLLGFLIGLGLTYLCFLFLVFQLSISLFYATIVSFIIGLLLTMGLAFSYRIRCLIFLLLPQFFSRAGRYTLTCYALVLILTGPATNTLKNSEVLTESMACRQEQIKNLLNEVKDTARRPLNAMRDSIKTMVQKLRLFARELKQTLLKVNRLTLSVLETIQSTFSWLQWLSGVCNKVMGSPFDRCLKVLREGAFDYKRRFGQNKAQIRRMANKIEEVCSNVKQYRAICVFTDFVNGSFVASIRRRLKDYSERIRNLLYLQIHVHHTYSFSSNTSHSSSQVAAGIVTEIRKRADPLLTWLSWSSCVTSLFLLLIIFRAKYYQHMFETRSRFDNKYITKELRDLDLKRLRHGRETILPLNKRERSKYVSTTSFRLVASEKIHLNRSIVFMAITTFKLLIHMVADYSLYWVLMTIRHHGKNQTLLPFGVPNAGMHITGIGRIADMFRSLLAALTSPLDRPQSSPKNCLPDPHPPNLQRYTQIGILIFLLWFFALFEPYGLRLRHVIMGLYRPERAKARAEWLYNHILRTRGGFMKFARRKLHRSYKYCSEEKHTLKQWLNEHIPFCWLRCLLGISKEEANCLLCGAKEDPTDPNTKHQKCNTRDCPGVYCCSCFSDIGELCTICLSPSDYGDLSDISLENGSSDESDDESGGSDGATVTPENDDKISGQYTFDEDSDNILLPKPLRENKNDRNVTRSNGEDENPKTTRLKIQTYHFKEELFNPTDVFLNIDFTKNLNMWKIIKIIKRFITITFNSDWTILKTISIIIHIMEIKNIENSINVPTEGNNNKTFCKEKHTKDNNGHNEYKTQQTQNRSGPKDVGEKKDDRENNSNGLDEKNNGIKKKGGDIEHSGQDNINIPEKEFHCLKQFNAIFCSYWLNMKNNLFDGCNFLTQAMINKTQEIDEKNNFKTRKKFTVENPECSGFRSDTEDSREYRLFAFLAEREWVIKKTIRYGSTEQEISLLNEKPDTQTVENLKEDLYSHTVHYKEVSFAHGTTSSLLPKRSGEPKQNQNIKNKVTSYNPSTKQHVLVCEDCKFNCLCPGNPANFLRDLPVVEKDIKKASCTERGVIIAQVPTLIEGTTCCTGTKPKKASVIERMKACLKSLFSSKHKKGKVCEKTSKTHSLINKIQEIKCQCVDRSVQFDKNDCPYHNRSIQVFPRHEKRTRAEECSGPTIVDARGLYQAMTNKCDPLCPAECECNGYGLNPLMPGSCDALCPIECQCHGEGLLLEKCDPLCPDECTCKGHGLKIEKCDELCPEECDCLSDIQENQIHKNTRRLAEHLYKLNQATKNDVKLKCTENNQKKSADEVKIRRVDVECQCPKDCSYAEATKIGLEKFCSCAVQCIPPECDRKQCCISSPCSSCTVSIVSDTTLISDITGTDNTCYTCFDYYDGPRRRRPRFVVVTKQNQSTGTDTAIKCTVGTITNQKGLVRKHGYYRPENHIGDVRVVEHKLMETRGVCTKKLVTFRSRVNIIPSNSIGSTLDIYTPSRYLLESQRYYNELFAYMPYVYPIRAIQERIHKKTSPQGSKSRYRKGGRLENISYVKRKKIIPKKQGNDPLAKHLKSHRKKNLSS